jgi:hypothetical protein
MELRPLALSLLVAASLSIGSFGCSSSSSEDNKAPVIDSLTGPATATIGASGNYELTLTLSCHDDDGAIAQATIEIPNFASNVIKTPAQSTLKDVQVQLQLDGRATKGPLEYTLVITDDQGAKASKSATVTLQ